MAILLLLFKRAIIAPNKLIDSQHYKRHRRKMMIEFHSPSHFHPHNHEFHSPSHFHPNHAVKSINLENFKLLTVQNDPDTGRIFSQPPLISFKRDKNIGNFLVRVHSKQVINPKLLNAHLNAVQNKSFHSQR